MSGCNESSIERSQIGVVVNDPENVNVKRVDKGTSSFVFVGGVDHSHLVAVRTAIIAVTSLLLGVFSASILFLMFGTGG